MVAFQDPTNAQNHPLFWALDLDCHMSDYAASMSFFDFLTEGVEDMITGKYWVDLPPEEFPPLGLKEEEAKGTQRHYMVCPYI